MATPEERTDTAPATAPAPENGGKASTTLAALRPAETPMAADQRAGFTDAGSFALLQRAAKMMSESTLVPKAYQNNIPNCAVALEMAQRIGASPLMVAQNLDVIYNRPFWRATFVIACINQSRRFSPLRYRWVGKPGEDTWGCIACAYDLAGPLGGDGKPELLDGPLVTIAISKSEGWYQREGSKWKSIPQLMLQYRAASWFGRVYAPEVTMGLATQEEVEDIVHLERGPGGTYEMADLQRAIASETGGAAAGPAPGGAAPATSTRTRRGRSGHAPSTIVNDADAGGPVDSTTGVIQEGGPKDGTPTFAERDQAAASTPTRVSSAPAPQPSAWTI